MISCKSYRSAWIRLLLCCLQRLTWIPISEHHHGSQIRVRVTSVIFIELLKFFSVNQKCKREIFSSLCCFLVCLFHKWHQAWLNSILLQIYICFNKHAYFSKNEQNFERNKFENLVYPEINLDSDFTSGEDKHLRYTTCAVRPAGQKRWIKGLEMPAFDQVHLVLHTSHVFCCCFSLDLRIQSRCSRIILCAENEWEVV